LGHFTGAAMKRHLTMSYIELDRLQVLQKIVEHRLTQAAAAQVLGLSYRQANTAAAKSRVERTHGTLQDRLVKEMRLEGILSIADANAWIDTFVEIYNARFSKPPGLPINLHRPLMDFEDLDNTFTWQEQRSLSASLTLQYDKVLYLVDPSRENQKLAKARWADNAREGTEAIAAREAQHSLPYSSLPCPGPTHLEKITSLYFDSD
jgi:hypothetical protein